MAAPTAWAALGVAPPAAASPPGRRPRQPPAGGCGPIGLEKFTPHRISDRSDRAKFTGRLSIRSSRPFSSRWKRSGKAASISGVAVGKEAIGSVIRVLV
ncbi:MAG: hypothetical protein E6G94_07805 [Alphaproteobacteria bacterium]|nr:MAG: hypothetical protein E6G94_07805 [Alphaproteobacteria bacterium]